MYCKNTFIKVHDLQFLWWDHTASICTDSRLVSAINILLKCLQNTSNYAVLSSEQVFFVLSLATKFSADIMQCSLLYITVVLLHCRRIRARFKNRSAKGSAWTWNAYWRWRFSYYQWTLQPVYAVSKAAAWNWVFNEQLNQLIDYWEQSSYLL